MNLPEEETPQVPPRATYRLQFCPRFGFAAAAAQAPYIARLGVSHVYASPYLAARPGSEHGYDVVDHNRLNEELGSAEDYQRMLDAFARAGLKQILDFVPNHVGVGGSSNAWWLEVLEWGPEAPHASAFDIDWQPERRDMTGKLLVPMLGEQYGAALEAGRIEVRFDAAAGEFAVWIPGGHKLPIAPRDYGQILGRRTAALAELSAAFADIPERGLDEARALKALLATLAAQDVVEDEIAAAVRRLNGRPGRAASVRRLDRLIARQHWRAAYWRVAADEINYRRFFNIHELAGLRVEDDAVFDAVHAWVLARLQDGTLDGLRIDHIDGLFDPGAYCRRLRSRVQRPFYLVIEKILASHERLREDWAVHGTTGYEFAALVTGLAVDGASEEAFARLYAEFTGEGGTAASYAQLLPECKRLIMQTELASELNVLALMATRVARADWRSRDFTLNGLREALMEVIAHFPVYRSYIDSSGVSEADRRTLGWAVARARRAQRVTDASVFDFLETLLLGDLPARGAAGGYSAQSVLRFAMKTQQLTGPVMAKGVEDTAFYRFNRLLCLNEVGSRPDSFGVTAAAFHRAMNDNVVSHPATMLATSTHDTKRGEDARARLAVLSELPDDWQRNLRAWSRLVRARRGDVEGRAPPGPNDEYLVFQSLLAAWPAALSGTQDLDAAILDDLRLRLQETMIKSVREAKTCSSWARPDEEYENGLRSFIDACLDASRSNLFIESFRPFQAQTARLGMINSLAQTVLKLTAPGVPDIYQGSELWELSLVDPDNRRPVDYEARTRMLDSAAALPDLLRDWYDGRVKLEVTRRLLQLRAGQPLLFARGGYLPLQVEGGAAEHAVAFARAVGNAACVVIVPRLVARLEQAGWGDTRIVLPDVAPYSGRRWRNVFGDTLSAVDGGAVRLRVAMEAFPAAVLVAL